MWKVPTWMWLVILLPPFVVGAVFLFLAATNSPAALADDGTSLQNLYYIVGGCCFIFPLAGALGIYYFYKRINDRESYLINEGIPGEAEILNREQTGTYLNEQPQVKFQLLITIPGEEPYHLEHKEYVNLLDVGFIAKGVRLPVMVDPHDPKNIILIYG